MDSFENILTDHLTFQGLPHALDMALVMLSVVSSAIPLVFHGKLSFAVTSRCCLASLVHVRAPAEVEMSLRHLLQQPLIHLKKLALRIKQDGSVRMRQKPPLKTTYNTKMQ